MGISPFPFLSALQHVFDPVHLASCSFSEMDVAPLGPARRIPIAVGFSSASLGHSGQLREEPASRASVLVEPAAGCLAHLEHQPQ